ncbi:hypothetical protein D5086_017025 [Populus alba]|uniref:Uncharacterized protein n=1 Tax=Populus alba TaxID=43335 RepID=A0ACC4BYC6_POPAL
MKTAPLTTYGDVSSQHGFVVTTAEGLLVQDSCQRPCLRFLPPVPPLFGSSMLVWPARLCDNDMSILKTWDTVCHE